MYCITFKIPILQDKDTGNKFYYVATFEIHILTETNILPVYNSSPNRDLKCNRIHYQNFHVVSVVFCNP